MARHIATRVKAFTLFATHYFELTALASEVEGCVNVHLDATEHGEGIVFLHAVREGPANRSYGLQVAQLAGVPREVIAQARRYLEALESQRDRMNAAGGSGRRLAANRAAAVRAGRGRCEGSRRSAGRGRQRVRRGAASGARRLEPDSLSPRAALDAVYSCASCSQAFVEHFA